VSILSNFEVESKNLSQESEIPSKEFKIQRSKLQFNAFREKRCKALTGLTLNNLKTFIFIFKNRSASQDVKIKLCRSIYDEIKA